MHVTIKLLYILFFSALSLSVLGQDLIHLKNGNVIENVDIKNMDSDKIFYTDYNDSVVIHSIYQTQVLSIEKNTTLKKREIPNDHKNQIKADLFGFVYGAYTFGYERSLNAASSVEGFFSIRDRGIFQGYEGGVRYKNFFSRSLLKKKAEYDLFHGAYSFVVLGYGNQKRNVAQFDFTTNSENNYTIISKSLFGGLGIGHQMQLRNFSFDGTISYLYFKGITEIESVSSVSIRNPGEIVYDNGAIFRAGKGGLMVSFSLGMQF